MKKLILLAPALLLLAGCNNEEVKPQPEVEIQEVKTVGEAQSCGGSEGKFCEAGLDCVSDFDKADGRGRCTDTVVDKEIECTRDQKPVCAIRDRVKNGYLNECEATRHGATILSTGFCQKSDEAIGDCQAKAMAIGICPKVTRGYEFDGKKCVEKNVRGCDAELPFPSMESCEQNCQ